MSDVFDYLGLKKSALLYLLLEISIVTFKELGFFFVIHDFAFKVNIYFQRAFHCAC